MDKFWIIVLAIGLFSVLSFVFFKVIRSFTREKFGQKWLKGITNKLYFWQSVIFMSTACTALILYLMKVGNLLN